MPPDAPCRRCGVRPATVVKRSWYLRGRVLWATRGHRTHVGCRRCVNRRVALDLLASLVLGWWCVPWGLGTPIVVVQNLGLLVLPAARYERRLEQLLAAQDQALLDAVVAVASGSIWADGRVTREEFELAGRFVVATSTRPLALHDASELIRLARGTEPAVADLSAESRRLLLAVAVQIVTAKGRVDPAEVAYVDALADRCGLPPVEELPVARSPAPPPPPPASPEDRARRILGATPGDDPAELRRKYHALLRAVHPDVAGPDPERVAWATAATQEINWAYEQLAGYSPSR